MKSVGVEGQRERFRIICETNAEQLGVLLAHMARMGLDEISYELVTEVRRFDKNAPRKTFEVPARAAVLNFMERHPTFKMRDLVAEFRAAGRTSGAAYGATHNLVRDGALTKLGDGNYRRSDLLALEGPKNGSGGATKGKGRGR